MKSLTITSKGDRIHIEDYPAAEKIVPLQHPQARRFADLALHQADLAFAVGCLEGINTVPDDPPVIREELWRAAIIHVMKCFDATGARSPLDADHLYGGEAVAAQVSDYFRKLRNKHLVHDENAWLQSHPGVVLNAKDTPRPIEDVAFVALRICTLEQWTYGNLMLLPKTALGWVEREMDRLHAGILADLVTADIEELRARPALTTRIPTIDDLGRKKP